MNGTLNPDSQRFFNLEESKEVMIDISKSIENTCILLVQQ